MFGIVRWIRSLVGRAGRTRGPSEYRDMSWEDLTRNVRSMGDSQLRPGESLREWNARIQPKLDAYRAWKKEYFSDPAHWPPGELAMRDYIYQTGDAQVALEKLLAEGFAEHGPDGALVLNEKGRNLQHHIYMSDR